MSNKGIYVALSGAMAQNLKMDTIANNLANVNTPAFKRDQQLFQEYLTANEKEGGVIQVPRIPASIESFYDMNGGDKSFVDSKGSFTDFSQGGLKVTGNTFDVALDGKGFFEIATPSGVRLTRAGNFTLDGNGQLVTKDGYPVLNSAEPGADPASRTIKIQPGQMITINDRGQIIQGNENIAQLSVVDVLNPDSLRKIGSNNYAFKDNMPAQIQQLSQPSVRQGFLEGSNVNLVGEMTELIMTQRTFESAQKAMSAYDSMAEKLVNVVGKTTP